MDTRKNPSSDTKLVARHAISTFGAPPSVWRFTCEQKEFSIGYRRLRGPARGGRGFLYDDRTFGLRSW